MKYAYVAGYVGADRDELRAKAGAWIDRADSDKSWAGHLIGLVAGRFLIDPAIDQGSSVEYSCLIDPCVLVADLGVDTAAAFQSNPDSALELKVLTDRQHEMEIHYERTDDKSWLDSEAWNDEGLPLITMEILRAMRGVQRRVAK